MIVQSAPTAKAESELADPPFNISLVEEMLRLFARAMRAHQLYLHNNPTYLKALENVKGAFAPIWQHTEELTFEVTDTQLKWEGHVVVNEPDKTSDALPWVLYKDGIRELQLRRDVETQEIITLLQIIAKVRKASPDEDDLLTLLWEQEFAFVRYRYVDVSMESTAPLEASDDAAKERLVESRMVQEPPREEILPTGVVNLDYFSATLYFLDEREVEYLRGEIQAEYASDLRTNVVASLVDIYEQQSDTKVRDEITRLLDGMLVQLLSAGHLKSASYLLREVTVAAGRARDLSPAQKEALLGLPSRMSDPDALTQLLQTLDDWVELPAQEDLNALFDQLRVTAMATVFVWLGKVQSPRVRQLLESAASRLAAANTAELVRLIGAPEREVMLEAVRRAGAMKAAAAVPALARLAVHADASVRIVAVQALAEIGTPGALQQLERGIEDSERDVRVASARAFATRTHRPALAKLEGVLKGKRIHEADLTEKMAFFEAYGAMCGDAGVSMLDGYLNGKGLFGRREDPELRACAAMALGKVGSNGALAALQKASTDKEILVRNAVNRILRGGTA
ncbi:MAG: HEAT repeat domain-containing protein [Gemmatimonadaceae bacterium]